MSVRVLVARVAQSLQNIVEVAPVNLVAGARRVLTNDCGHHLRVALQRIEQGVCDVRLSL